MGVADQRVAWLGHSPAVEGRQRPADGAADQVAQLGLAATGRAGDEPDLPVAEGKGELVPVLFEDEEFVGGRPGQPPPGSTGRRRPGRSPAPGPPVGSPPPSPAGSSRIAGPAPWP